jgi:hypothetical protein
MEGFPVAVAREIAAGPRLLDGSGTQRRRGPTFDCGVRHEWTCRAVGALLWALERRHGRDVRGSRHH